MKITRSISRRSFLSAVVGGASLTASGALAQTGITNSDPGDPAGNGRLRLTDRDTSDRLVSRIHIRDAIERRD